MKLSWKIKPYSEACYKNKYDLAKERQQQRPRIFGALKIVQDSNVIEKIK